MVTISKQFFHFLFKTSICNCSTKHIILYVRQCIANLLLDPFQSSKLI